MAAADDSRWFDSLSVHGGVNGFFMPAPVSDWVKANPDWRLGLGYEIGQARFALEYGVSRIDGVIPPAFRAWIDNPMVRNISYKPLFAKAGYAVPLPLGFQVQGDIAGGYVFADVGYYEIVIDNIRGEETLSSGGAAALAGRLYLNWQPQDSAVFGAVRFYGGGGVDLLLETGGAIPLPLIEAGIAVRPLSYLPKKPAAVPEKPILRTVNVFSAVYFPPDSPEAFERYRSEMDGIGRLLQQNPELTASLRGYTARFSTPGARLSLSNARIAYCADYLEQNYGIEKSRLETEAFGSDRKPEFADEGNESLRCVEITVSGTVNPAEQKAQEAGGHSLSAVYFPPDSPEMFERYIPVLDRAGRLLQENPDLTAVLRGYTAGFSTPGARANMSGARAAYCASYLQQSYGIEKSRLTTEAFGSDRKPETSDAGAESLRCVEIIIQWRENR